MYCHTLCNFNFKTYFKLKLKKCRLNKNKMDRLNVAISSDTSTDPMIIKKRPGFSIFSQMDVGNNLTVISVFHCTARKQYTSTNTLY